jgi:hypothetical protein
LLTAVLAGRSINGIWTTEAYGTKALHGRSKAAAEIYFYHSFETALKTFSYSLKNLDSSQ